LFAPRGPCYNDTSATNREVLDMAFEKVDTQVGFPAQERAILDFWERDHTFDKLRAQNRGRPKWSFLDGPITANNPMGVHHAWGRTYKDLYQRYFAMTGHEERYQNGFDCQGLWVEVEVEKELKLKSKRDIENLVPGDRFASIDKFVQLCKQRVDKFARIQTDQSIRLGYWTDWDRDGDWAKPPDERRSYFTMSEENNYTIWSFLKKCSERGLVYRGYDAMPWCPRCAVGISQMEMHEGYQLVAHRAVFVRFPLRGRRGEYLLVWTTTPWTLTSNVAAAVNPQLRYAKVRHKDETYYVAKGALTAQRLEEQFKRKEWVEGVPKLKTLEQLFKEKGGCEVVGEVSGAELVGWTYDGPFDELPAQAQPGGYPAEIADVVRRQKWAPAKSAKELHRVIAWDAVGEAEGTGIVHIAPGCGKEDFLLGKAEGLPPLAPLDEYGVFVPGYGALTGKHAVDPATTDAILADLQQKGLLFAVERYPHSYPHCWRCKTELLFRLVDEWFINMGWREEIMRVCHDIRWIPEEGLKRELDWLKNMGDWMISKKRFWGLALPIWVDEQTGDFEVIGARAELKARAVEGWDRFEGHSPHRPWIDLVKIRNPKTGNLMSRIPDVGNPWLDAGIVPYSTVGYNRDRAYWEKWFPADFITESFPGQFRNWFYALLAMSTMMTGRAPFKTLLGHGLVRDQKGEDMHKSKGNAIPFDGAVDTGYKLFHDRDAKVGLEAQAHRDLPEGWLEGSLREETVILDNKPRLVVSAGYPPMGADEMRWLYSRHNPSLNINFGPEPAEELRSRFLLKLWNTYAFFCNYARLDGFDPAAPQVPVAKRPDLDRWILSDLQLLIQTARREYERFNVQAFCLQTEAFVDDKLSNWYVRRNRRRFWKSDKGEDKLAAYQTLYSVLTTLTRLCAPVMPFLTEGMYQNLEGPGGSVHLQAFPEANEALIDRELSEDMEALLRLVSLGSAARNSVKIKVRQPLAEMKIRSDDDSDRQAVERFAHQILDELNVKKVSIVDKNSLFFTYEPFLVRERVKFDFGSRAGQVIAAFEKLPKEKLRELANREEPLTLVLPSGDSVSLVPLEDIEFVPKGLEGWAVAAHLDTVVGVDTRITEDLAKEGKAREVVRHVQNLRKDAGLEMDDRIVLYLHTVSDKLRQAIEAHRGYIMNETLATQWATKPLDGDTHHVDVKVDGQALRIELRKVD
jgi:isoleucyl-tRNA synthetase